MQGWEGMRRDMVGLLERATGQRLEAWNARVRDQDPPDEQALRAWLHAEGVHGYAQSLLVFERFGYPEFFTATAGELVEQQYADRPQLRPVLDAVLALASELPDAAVQARKTYVCLVTPRRTFAQLLPATRTRLDLGLRLPDDAALPRATSALGNSTHRLGLTSVEDVDAGVQRWLAAAYAFNQ